MSESVRDAAAVLVAKLHAIHADARYASVWTLAAVHGAPYNGPTYTAELANLEAALATVPDAGEGEE